MKCPKCKIEMVESKRSYHKQRKWVCPRCKRVRFQPVRQKRRDNKETAPE